MVYEMNIDLVAFGPVVLADLILVDELPLINTGIQVKNINKYLSDDAVIVATLLSQWKMNTGLICTEIPDDDQGQKILNWLHELNIIGEFRISPNAEKPYEVTISDSFGNRTYFWRRDYDFLKSLDSANIDIIADSKFLYVDWYDDYHISRPIEFAISCDVPVFLNLEYGHQYQSILDKYAKYSTIVQSVTDSQQHNPSTALNVANKILNTGPKIVIVTMAENGCLVTDGNQYVRVYPPTNLQVVDVNGAGATFSAAFLFGFLNDWKLDEIARFAVAAASLKCTEIGVVAFPINEIKELSKFLDVEFW